MTIKWRKEQPLQQMVLGQLDTLMQRNEVRLLFRPYTKINSNKTNHLNIRAKTMIHLEKNT